MDKKVTVDIIVSSLCTALGIKQTQLARMLKINDSSISSNMEKSVDEIRTKKTGKRLLPLLIYLGLIESILEEFFDVNSVKCCPEYINERGDYTWRCILLSGISFAK